MSFSAFVSKLLPDPIRKLACRSEIPTEDEGQDSQQKREDEENQGRRNHLQRDEVEEPEDTKTNIIGDHGTTEEYVVIEDKEHQDKNYRSAHHAQKVLDSGQASIIPCERKPSGETMINDESISAENVATHFHEYFKKIEVLDAEQQLMYCELFQKSFESCRSIFIENLKQSLFALTELTKEENLSSKINIQQQKRLENVIKGYKFLLRYSSDKLKSYNLSELTEKVKGSLSDRNICFESEMDDLVSEAVEICWKMQMLPTPMFICQPKAFTEHWHDTHYDTWDENCRKTNGLVYYRPVLMNSVGGSIACRGLVGNSAENTSRSIKDEIQQSPLKEIKDKEVLTDLSKENDDKLPVLVQQVNECKETNDLLCEIMRYLNGCVHVAEKVAVPIHGDKPQVMNWKRYGLEIEISQGSLSSSEVAEIAALVLVGGRFSFPENTVLVSAVYALAASKPLLKPLKLEVQHCVDITRDTQAEVEYLKFASAKFTWMDTSDSTYEFSVEMREFVSANQYGSINLLLNEHRLICIVGELELQPRRHNQILNPNPYDYTPQQPPKSKIELKDVSSKKFNRRQSSSFSDKKVERHSQEQGNYILPCNTIPVPTGILALMRYTGLAYLKTNDVMIFTVVKNLDFLHQYIESNNPVIAKKPFCFKKPFSHINILFPPSEEALFNRWIIQPQSVPCRLSRCDIDNFGGEDKVIPPSCLISVFMSPNSFNKPKHDYTLLLVGEKEKIPFPIGEPQWITPSSRPETNLLPEDKSSCKIVDTNDDASENNSTRDQDDNFAQSCEELMKILPRLLESGQSSEIPVQFKTDLCKVLAFAKSLQGQKFLTTTSIC